MNNNESLRLDKWLWAARFYKTRKLAAEAISGGKVHVNRQRAKPGKEVKIGTQIQITIAQYSWDIAVTGLNSQRRPAKEAAQLYEETPESHTKRQKQGLKSRQEKTFYSTGQGKPNKKQRRLIHRFKRS